MWVAGGNTIIFIAFLYVILWVPMIPPKQIEKAMNDYAIDSSGERRNVQRSNTLAITGDRNRVNTILNRKATRGATMMHDHNDDEPFGPLVVLRQMGHEFREAWQ